jgi:hypothetical protein
MVRKPDDGHVITETCSEHILTELVRKPDHGHVSTETCSEHLLSGLVRRLDDGHVSTETCSEHLLSGLVRRLDVGHVRTETFSLSHNKYDVFALKSFIILISISASLCFCSTYLQHSSKLLWF